MTPEETQELILLELFFKKDYFLYSKDTISKLKDRRHSLWEKFLKSYVIDR